MVARALVCCLAVLGGAFATEVGAQRVPTSDLAHAPDTTFRHALHSDFTCLDCHAMQPAHGVRLVRNVADCRACHHVRERVDLDCQACHTAAEFRNVAYPVRRALDLSIHEAPVVREIPFQHADHEDRACAECHTEGPSFAVPTLDCQSCHEEHHEPTSSGCLNCHEEPADDAHTLEVHQSCSGSGCHVNPPFSASPRTRVGCLWCHQEQADHEPQGECVDCHALAVPTSPLAGSDPETAKPGEVSPQSIAGIPRMLAVFASLYLAGKFREGLGR